MPIRKELLDDLIKDHKNSEDLIGDNGILKQLTKAPLERVMKAELTLRARLREQRPKCLKRI